MCNGHAELCGRPLNEVTFAGTHNSMAAADEPGWYFAAHRGGIAEQLDFGVRALLIDTHYGIRDKKGNVRTDLEREGTNRAKIVAAIGEEGLAAAERLVGRIGFGELEGKSGTYMCHTLCELGATPLEDGLRAIRTFLDEHPDEFVVLFIQDEVTPKDTAAVFDRAGLTRYAYTHERDAPWPTMAELIASDERLLVLVENDVRGGPPWYHDGFELTQETPYTFHSLDELLPPRSCRQNRGSVNSPLFLLNHWIERVNPSPGLAGEVERAPPDPPPRAALRRGPRPAAQHRRGRLLRRGRAARSGRRAQPRLTPLTRPAAQGAQHDPEDRRDHDEHDVRLRQVRLAVHPRDRVGREDERAEEDAAGEAADRALLRSDVLLPGEVSAGDAEHGEDEVHDLGDAEEYPGDEAEDRRHDDREDQLQPRRV